MKFFAAEFLALVLLPSLVFAASPDPSGKKGSEKDRWFWIGEACLEDLRAGTEGKSQAGFHRWQRAMNRAETAINNESSTQVEANYFQALRFFLSLDYPSAWQVLKDLEAVPAYAEEVRWLQWGPQAAHYRQAAGDWRWRRSAVLFRDGLEAFAEKRWREAELLFEKSLRQQPDHFLAAYFLKISSQKRIKDHAGSPVRSWPADVLNFRGTDGERLGRGEEDFQHGRWFHSLAWFDSLSRQGLSAEMRRRGVHSARRLGWMFPTAPDNNSKLKAEHIK